MTASVTHIDRMRIAHERRAAMIALLLDRGPTQAKHLGEAMGLSHHQTDVYLDWARKAGLVDRYLLCGLTARGIAVGLGLMPMPTGPRRDTLSAHPKRDSSMSEDEVKRAVKMYEAEMAVTEIARLLRRQHGAVSAAIRAHLGVDKLGSRGKFSRGKAPGPRPAW